jgi:diguanylate cyclase (GGDEF)-like protein
VGLLLLDLDRYKQVNDLHGHATGDAVLRHAAGHLAGAVGDAGLAVRLHGDEFAVLLPRLPAGRPGQQAAHRVAKRVGAALADPVVLGGVVHEVTASVGVAVCPRSAADLSVLLRVADQRMYTNKRTTCPVRGRAGAGSAGGSSRMC